MSCEFGVKLARALGAFLRNQDLILLANGGSRDTYRYIFSNTYLLAVGKIESQKEVSCILQRQGKENVSEGWT